jgi:hypothetical protein
MLDEIRRRAYHALVMQDASAIGQKNAGREKRRTEKCQTEK